MYWNNRIMQHKGALGGPTFAVHEVHYDSDTDKVISWTDKPFCGHYESVAELIADLKQKLADAEKSQADILDYHADQTDDGTCGVATRSEPK